jgi:hypothetical protein
MSTTYAKNLTCFRRADMAQSSFGPSGSEGSAATGRCSQHRPRQNPLGGGFMGRLKNLPPSGWSKTVIKNRLLDRGWLVERALTAPTRPHRKKSDPIPDRTYRCEVCSLPAGGNDDRRRRCRSCGKLFGLCCGGDPIRECSACLSTYLLRKELGKLPKEI